MQYHFEDNICDLNLCMLTWKHLNNTKFPKEKLLNVTQNIIYISF